MLDVVSENLTVEYELIREKETLVALWDFSLTIPTGEFLVIVGPSGCGKTTFIADAVRTGNPEQSIAWQEFFDLSYLNQAYTELGMTNRIRNP